MQKDKAALLVVDLQNDFCPGGALQILNGDRVIEPINRALECFKTARLPVLASRDWHPPVTSHFSAFGGSWPVHCVQETRGAAFHPALRLPDDAIVISKGLAVELAGYSAFEGIDDQGRPLAEILNGLGVKKLYVCGLATDYCVLCTTLDALRTGFKVTVLSDAIAGVDVIPGASATAIEKMEKAGAELATVEQLQAEMTEP